MDIERIDELIVERNEVTQTRTAGVAEPAPGAVVIGGDYQGLGILRSLGRRGVPVCVVDDEHSISRYSKYCTHFVKVGNLREERAIVDALIAVADQLGLSGWILYPTREELVAAISRNRDQLSRSFRVPTPAWTSVQWAWDKRNTYRLAQDLGIPTPRCFYPEGTGDLDKLNGVDPPFVVKPAIKEHFFYATKDKAWRADTHAELRSLFLNAARLVGPAEVMVQELIPGGGSQQFAFCAFFKDGEAVGKMVARRRRQHPLQFGRASTYVETTDIPILEDYSCRFLKSANYYGLVELEYKLDPRDDQFKLLDVNARSWGYHSLGQAAGVDFSYMLYADQLGLPVPSCRAEPGIGWVRMATDLPAAAVAMLNRDIDLVSYVRSLGNCNVEAVFTFDDPLPALVEILLIPYLAVTKGF
jgi:predicted ATP-grasp superfamily ATP-dependent carboligase